MGTSMSETGRSKVGGYVYVAGFECGLVKVGRTANPRARLSGIRGVARTFGRTLTENWLSPLHLEYKANEAALIAAVKTAGGASAQREYFTGITFQRARDLAEALTFQPFDLDAELAKHVDEGRKLRDFLMGSDTRRAAAQSQQAADLPDDYYAQKLITRSLPGLSSASLMDVVSRALNEIAARDGDVDLREGRVDMRWGQVLLSDDEGFVPAFFSAASFDEAIASGRLDAAPLQIEGDEAA